MTSTLEDMNDFYHKYGDYFDMPVINYTRQIVQRIKSSPALKNFLEDNKISTFMLLNEITPYSQFKYKQFGNEKLEMKEIQSILNIILFSNEIEKMILEDHVHFSSIGEYGEMNYIADQYATDYFNNKFEIEIKENEEFDFTILEDKYDQNQELGFGVN